MWRARAVDGAMNEQMIEMEVRRVVIMERREYADYDKFPSVKDWTILRSGCENHMYIPRLEWKMFVRWLDGINKEALLPWDFIFDYIL